MVKSNLSQPRATPQQLPTSPNHDPKKVKIVKIKDLSQTLETEMGQKEISA